MYRCHDKLILRCDTLYSMGETAEGQGEKGIGKCDGCANLFVVATPENAEAYIVGGSECPECGSNEFTIVEEEDLGIE